MSTMFFRVSTVAFAVLISFSVFAGDIEPPGAPSPTLVNLETINDNAAAARSNASSAANEARAAQDPRTPITGIPVSLEEPGSYYLTGNMTLSANASAHGILVLVDDVTIDLNGFTLTAQDASAGAGVLSLAGSRTAVMNGTIAGWGGNGVALEGVEGCTVRGINAVNNGGTGIRAGDDFLLVGCQAVGNGLEGIRTGDRGALRDCTATENSRQNFYLGSVITGENLIATRNGLGSGILTGGRVTLANCHVSESPSTGFSLGSEATLIGCQSSRNGADGFITSTESTLENCLARLNGEDGFTAGPNAVLRGCVSRANDVDGFSTGSALLVNCYATRNNRHGFRTGSHSTVLGCQAHNNGVPPTVGAGFDFRSGSRIDGNHASANGIGFQTTTSISSTVEDCIVVRNTAISLSTQSLASNYHVDSAVNTVGLIINSHGTPGVDPWANFSH